jgi:hypothetical protein
MKRFSFFAALGLLACGGITEPVCACSPPEDPRAVITGLVTTGAQEPVPGARVKVQLMDEPCTPLPVLLVDTVQAGANGRFRHTESWSGGRKCFRVWAEPPQGSPLAASDSQFVRIGFLQAPRPDSVEVALRLR